LMVMPEGDRMRIMQVKFNSRAEKLGFEQGFEIVSIEVIAERPDKELMFLLAAALLAGVVANQRRRRYWGRSERSLGLD